MPSMLSPRFLWISGLVLCTCAALGLAVFALTGRPAPSRFEPPTPDVQAQLLAELARLRQAQVQQGAPASAGAEMQALEAQLEALRKTSPGDPSVTMKQVQQDLEHLQAASQPQPSQIERAVRISWWALALSILAVSLFLGQALKPVVLRGRIRAQG